MVGSVAGGWSLKERVLGRRNQEVVMDPGGKGISTLAFAHSKSWRVLNWGKLTQKARSPLSLFFQKRILSPMGGQKGQLLVVAIVELLNLSNFAN